MSRFYDSAKDIERLINAESIGEIVPDYVPLEPASRFNLTPGTALVAGSIMTGILAGVASPNKRTFAQELVIPEPSIVVIGDSLTAGRKTALEQQFTFSGINTVKIDGLGSRQTIYGPCDSNVLSAECQTFPDGLRAVESLPTEIGTASAVVLALGTNDRVDDFKDELLRLSRRTHELGVSGDQKAPLIIIPEIFGESSRVSSNQKNIIISEVIIQLETEGIKATSLPYKNFVDSSVRPNGGVSQDEVHLTPAGYQQLAVYESGLISSTVDEYHSGILYPPSVNEPPQPSVSVPTLISVTNIDTPNIDLNTPFILDISMPKKPEISDSAVDNAFLVDATPFVLDITKPVKVPEQTILPQSGGEVNVLNSASTVIQPMVFDTSLPLKEQLVDQLPQVEEQVSVDQLLNMSAEVDIEAVTPIVEATSVEIPPVSPPAPEVLGTPEYIDVGEYYYIDENNVVHDEPLLEFIRNRPDIFAKALPSQEFPNGDFYRIPDKFSGLPYYFNDIASPNERFASIEVVAGVFILAHRHIDRQARFPGLDDKYLQDAVSKHKEHRHGGDIDWGLNNIPEARLDEFLDMIRLRRVDGSAYIRHIVTGDETLEYTGDKYLGNLGYERPNLILQEDHGTEPGNGPHLHLSFDGGQSGPFFQPEANVPLTWGVDQPQAPVFGGDYVPGATSPQTNNTGTNLEINTESNIEPIPVSSGFILNINNKPRTEEAEPEPNTTVSIDEILLEETIEVVPRNQNRGNNNNQQNTITETVDEILETETEVVDSSDWVEEETIEVVPRNQNRGNNILPEPPDEVIPAPEPEIVLEPEPELISPPSVPEPLQPLEPAADPNDASLGHIPQYIYDKLRSPEYGYTHAGAIGWLANFAMESGLNPTRAQNTWKGTCAVPPERLDPSTKQGDGTKGQGFGLGQWTLDSRQEELQRYADSTSRVWTDIDVQLEHARNEGEYFDINGVLRSTENVDEATILILAKFENPQAYIDGGANRQGVINERVERARVLNQQISNGDFAGIDVSCD
jgi:lysophospholipase L1-like esterase